MLELGKIQTLTVVRKKDMGVYLSKSTDSSESVLLPIKQVPKNIKIGDKIEVFLYLDSKDRIISTINKPLIQLGEVALLKVAATGKIGAFVESGLEKDLLLPFREQTKPLRKGEEVLCALYIDKTGRLCVTMKLYDYLKNNSPYKVGDTVKGRIYEVSKNFGAFVAVDDIYSALIPKKELYGQPEIGQVAQFRVTNITEDNRLTLASRKQAYLQINEDAEKVLKIIKEFDGVLPFTDKASPETIKREFNMSKNEFKRAVGHLYKERKIEITEKSIRIIK